MIFSILYAATSAATLSYSGRIYKSFLPSIGDEKVSKYIEEHDLPKNLSILNMPIAGLAGSTGTRFSDSSIILGTTFHKLNDKVQNFILNHEFGHIKHEDPLLITSAGCLTLFAFEAFSSLYSLKTLIAFFGVTALISTISERRADAYAREYCASNDLKSAICFFKAKDDFENEKFEKAKSLSYKLYLYLNWVNYHFLQGHPFNATRATLIKNELLKREESFQMTQEDLKAIEIMKQSLWIEEKSPLLSQKETEAA